MALTRQELQDTLNKFWCKSVENIKMPSTVQYWNGNMWINWPSMTRLEREVQDELKENVEELIRRGVSRNPCKFCTSLGRILCHCPLDKQSPSPYYSMGVDASRDFLLGCTPPKTVIQHSRNFGRTTVAQMHFGFQQQNNIEVELDEVVDHLLLKGEIEIEVSL